MIRVVSTTPTRQRRLQPRPARPCVGLRTLGAGPLQASTTAPSGAKSDWHTQSWTPSSTMPSWAASPTNWTGSTLCSLRSATTRALMLASVWFGLELGRLERSCSPASPSRSHREYHCPGSAVRSQPRPRRDKSPGQHRHARTNAAALQRSTEH